jgi:8-oxo-dGTP diphosphatase
LSEEFEIESSIGEFFMESVYHYEEKSTKLLVYRAILHLAINTMNDHDKIFWLAPHCLRELKWAPADDPIAEALQGDGQDYCKLIRTKNLSKNMTVDT